MGLLKLLIDVLDHASTVIVLSVVANVGYTAFVDYSVSEHDDVQSFLMEYSPDFKSLKFYKVILQAIYDRLI